MQPLLRLITQTKPTHRSRLQIACRVKPNASPLREGITAVGPDRVEICVAAVARDGEANAAVTRILAEVFSIPKSDVEVIRGTKARDKTLCLDVEIHTGEEEFLHWSRGVLEGAIKI
ncbi:hypothetical protein ASPZODRAFT_13617 [Penicilliopsis zonata CBS 506.65]|uniref:Uncharacterized protein n=1 Tax=Penicilliopsis zonata CBS 506.65 TaxID=1073090 RepID=A0A1L9SNW4_9EURO|nr:hypothetical protein ASPZODRAFT_13617 [Penicilliopsis zonata CBS 506.65]OJJ48880.1 hypothetical protein ASPZODRAFT_13617 [Penicilliopsis zonata CBS 506.65]